MGIKLSAKFARQESEEARLARIARKRIPPDRAETIRRMLGILESERETPERRDGATGALSCPEWPRHSRPGRSTRSALSQLRADQAKKHSLNASRSLDTWSDAI